MKKTKLQIMREKKGLTVEQLAEKCVKRHKAHKQITYFKDWVIWLKKIETGKYCMQKEYAKVVAQALGCSVDELVEEE